MKKYKSFLVFLPIMLLAQSCSFLTGGQSVTGGILKSLDGGENWDAANTINEESSLLGISAPDLIIDPADNNLLYLAASGSGLYASSNQAQSWSRVLAGADMVTVKVNLKNNQEVFVGGRSGGIAKVFRSQDAGQTWIEVFSESRKNTFVSALAISEVSPNIIFIGLSTGEVIRSSNSGVSWNLAGVLRGRIVEIELFKNSTQRIIALSISDGLFVSDDGGGIWSEISGDLSASNYLDFVLDESNQNVVYLATNRGLYRTGNLGGSWQKMELPLNKDSETVTAVALNQNNNSEIFAVVAQTLYKSSDSGESWQTRSLATNASVRRLIIDQSQANVMYAALGNPLR